MPTAIAIAAIITGLILYSFIRKRPVNKKRSETIATNITAKDLNPIARQFYGPDINKIK